LDVTRQPLKWWIEFSLIKVNRISATLFGFSPMHPVQAMAVALNSLTRQQVWAAQRLALHAGKTVRICVGGFQLNWSIGSDGQLAHASEDSIPDVTLEIQLEKLSPLAWLNAQSRPDIAEYVHVSGQAALAQVMSELARDLRPDPEEALSRWVGDVPARRIVRGAQQAFGAAQTLGKSLTQNLAEYLSEETDALVGRPAMTSQFQHQSQLLSTLDRLERMQSTLKMRTQKLERARGFST
jgi:ubiquinone biosynthesis protein UbiJ